MGLLETLGRELRGELVLPGAANYDEARRVNNGLYDRHPAGIAFCQSTADVVASVQAARADGLPIAIRSGGHHPAGHGTCDGGLLIDVSQLRSAAVDLKRGVAEAGAGLTVAANDRETFRYGYVASTGTCEDVAISGATLGGGYNFLSTHKGLACDGLVAAEIVTADGRVIETSAETEPDLFWAIRGAGANFGVVTRMTLRLHKSPPKIIGGNLIYTTDNVAELLRRIEEYLDTAPETVGLEVFLVPPEEPGGRTLVLLQTCCFEPMAEAEAALAPLYELGQVYWDDLRPIDFPTMNLVKGSGGRGGPPQYWTGDQFARFTDPIVKILDAGNDTARQDPARPGSRSLSLYPYRGELTRVPADATAFGRRDPGWLLLITATWPGGSDGSSHIAWADGVREALIPHAYNTVYLNSAMDSSPERIRGFYGAEKYARLQRLKARYDPENLFRFNPNIPPDANV